MKKVKAMLLACAVITASLCTSGISGGAEEQLVITRDADGNVTIVAEESVTDPLDDILLEDAAGTSTGLNPGEHGMVEYRFAYLGDSTVFLVTDSTGFDDSYAELPWMPDTSKWLKSKEITNESIGDYVAMSDKFVGYEEGYADWMDKYGSDARLYSLSFDGWAYDQIGQMPREWMLHRDNVLDAVHMLTMIEGTAYWNGKFTLMFNEEYDGVGQNVSYPESLLAYLDEQEAVYEEWNEACQAWMDSIDADSMTPAQLEVSRKEAGVASDYEMLQMAAEISRTIEEEYGDLVASVRPNYSVRIRAEYARPVSVWYNVGDMDKDGTLTAADAALILTLVANDGAGAVGTVASDSIDLKADINADYEYDASDAALLLQYLAESGAGSNMTLQEFVKYAE